MDEKDKIVKKLRRKTKEERKVINELKKHKIGEWGRGFDVANYGDELFMDERNIFLQDELREINQMTRQNEDDGDGNDNDED